MKTVCYVCNKEGYNMLYRGQGLYRHRSKCRPGREAWLKSRVAEESRIREFFHSDTLKMPGCLTISL